MLSFVKLVEMIAVSMTLFAAFGSAVAANRGHNEVLYAGVGAVVGILVALLAAGELDCWLDSTPQL